MKFYRNAIILVVVVALLAGAYFLVRTKRPMNSRMLPKNMIS